MVVGSGVWLGVWGAGRTKLRQRTRVRCKRSPPAGRIWAMPCSALLPGATTLIRSAAANIPMLSHAAILELRRRNDFGDATSNRGLSG